MRIIAILEHTTNGPQDRDNTYFWIDLKQRITAVAMMQILPIGDRHVLETMIAFEQALYATRSLAEYAEERGNNSTKPLSISKTT
jgi:hypothetical protein